MQCSVAEVTLAKVEHWSHFSVQAGTFYSITVAETVRHIFLNNKNIDIFFPEKCKCKWSFEAVCAIAEANA